MIGKTAMRIILDDAIERTCSKLEISKMFNMVIQAE